MNKLNSKNWQRVRISNKAKTITFTNDTTYKTKADCEKDIKSAQYIAINQNALNKLLSDGYMINDTTINPQQVNTVGVKETASNLIDLTGNAEVEAQIEAYAKAKIERDIQAYAEKKRKQDAVKNFLANPPKQSEQKPFDYSKQLDKFYSKQAPRNQRDKQRQIADYCSEVNI